MRFHTLRTSGTQIYASYISSQEKRWPVVRPVSFFRAIEVFGWSVSPQTAKISIPLLSPIRSWLSKSNG